MDETIARAQAPLRLSIALCTCDGQKFLRAQLESFLTQQHLPDELVVCDDDSTDGTFAILSEFAQRSPFPVRIVRNPERLGVVSNFEQAIRLCNGDIIVLSDQDDIWMPEKLTLLVREFSDSAVTAVFSDAQVVDEDLKPVGYRFWQRTGFDLSEQTRWLAGDPFGIFFRHFVVMGASLAFRSALRPQLLPIPPGWPHDAWVAAIAAAAGRVTPLPIALLQYRQHGANQVGGLKKSLIRQVLDGRKVGRSGYYRDELERWNNLLGRLPEPASDVRERVRNKLRHLHARAALPQSRWRRIPGVMRAVLAGDYARFTRNWGSVALDLFIK
jgi:glycosyltransferase involved in cell wall biosynthesis